jgi:hypothetical protein
MAEFHAGRYQYLTRANGTTVISDFFSPHVNIVSGNQSDFLLTSSDVYDNLDKIRFSSYWFNYLSVNTRSTLSNLITLPQRNAVIESGGKKGKDTIIRPYTGVSDYLVLQHNLNKTPAYAAWDANTGKVFSGVILLGAGNSKRILLTRSNENSIFLKEIFFVVSDNLPQISLSILVTIFNQFVEDEFIPDPNKDPLLITAEQCIFGKGKFDTDLGYVFKQDDSPYSIINRGGLLIEGNFDINISRSIRLRSFENGNLVGQFITNASNNTVFLEPFPAASVFDGNTFNIGFV